MSELISNPQPGPESRSTGPSGHVAHDGLDGLHHPGIVVRYDAGADPSDQPDDAGDVEDPAADVEESGAGARPAASTAGRTRAILGALAHGLLALSWACLRSAYRYPRWALVIVLSVVILGATALTRPGNPTPTASLPKENAPASSTAPDKSKDPEAGPKEPGPDPAALANAGSAPATGTQEANKSKEAGEKREAAAPPPATTPAPAAKVADARPAKTTTDEKAPPAITPPSAEKESVPAPPPLTSQTEASLLADASAGQAPAPAPPTPAPVASPPASSAATADPNRPDPGLPLLPGPDQKPAPVAASAAPPPSSPGGQSAGSGATAPGGGNKPAPPTEPAAQAGSRPLPTVEDVKLTGAAGPANAPPPDKPAHDSTGGTTGSVQPPITSPGSGPPPQPSPSQPATPAPGPSPAAGPATPPPSGPAAPSPQPSAHAPPASHEPQGLAPQPDPSAPAPSSKPEPTKGEQGPIEPPAAAGAANDHPAPGLDPVQPPPPIVTTETPPAPPEVTPESKGAAKPPELPQPGPKVTEPDRSPPPGHETPARPTSPVPGLEAPGPDAARTEKDPVGETPRPNILEEEDLRPGHEGPSTGSQGTTIPPRTTVRPELNDPPAGGNPPPKEESVTTPARPVEPPAAPPAAESAASKVPEPPVREEATEGTRGPSASEPAGSTAQPPRDLAEGGWVRIPNKGRIPSDIGGDPDAFAMAGRRGPDPAPDHRGQADTNPGFEPGSPADAKDRPITPSTGLGAAVRSIRPAGGSRTDAGSSRVEPSLHIVERGENFWTISRLYYGDGRYYRALWKANSRKYPNIKEIHINDVIQIPAVEDLDPAYVERPNRRPVSGREGGPARDLADGSATAGAGRPKSFPTTRTARATDGDDGIPARRAGRAAPELELPVGDADPGPAPGGRAASADRPDAGEDDGPTTPIRSTARSRHAAPLDRPVYKVRRYDTLRSIARDILGDPRRADELYDLNRDIIDDPTRLTAGQLLELPEDADTRRLTVSDRYRGQD